MRVIVDSNQLQSETLRGFLSKSKGNFAVLPDYVAMEAYKGDTLASIYKAMAILADFPCQVIVLKGTSAVCGLKGRPAGLQRRMIDKSLSSGFVEYAHLLRQAQQGNKHLQRQLIELGKEATAHLDQMFDHAKSTGAAIDDIASLHSKEERNAIRLGAIYSPELIDKTMRNVLGIAATVFHQYPAALLTPTYADLPNTYIFRVALCTYLLALDWGARGGARHATPAKLRNDFVDMSFAAYGTFFNGLMTADAKVIRIHREARIWLMALSGCELPREHRFGQPKRG